MPDASDRIGGEAWTIRQVFTARRYVLDSYQREYSWKQEHLQDLINDLSRRFIDEWKPSDEIPDVARYRQYFLGPIVTYRRPEESVIVDGQQRLTTLMLLLIWLDRLQSDREDAVDGLRQLVFFLHFGKRRFAVEDPAEPREPYLAALLDGRDVPPEQEMSRSARNLLARYAEIEDLFPDEIRQEALPFFIYWLLERVLLVEISTYSDSVALETFETMNDRGLRLASIDLLKSFILNQVNAVARPEVNQVWRARLARLVEADGNGHVNFVKSWFRAKFARSAADDDAIGHSFDKWLRQHHEAVGLRSPFEFRSLVVDDMDRLSSRYLTLLEASRKPIKGLDPVYFNGMNSATVQFPLILAAVSADDPDTVFLEKAAMVGGFLDIYVARRMVNGHDYRYDAIAPSIFALAREIRGMDVPSLASRLGDEVSALPEGFEGIATYALRHGTRGRVKYLLSRISAWLEVQVHSGAVPLSYAEETQRLRPYEIEHVWADRPDQHPEVPARRFSSIRNRLGALLLLTRDFNASYGDMAYVEKINHYNVQKLTLARSLHPMCYEGNPSFLRLIAGNDLPFRAFPTDFDEAAIEQRQRLYQRLCELVWDPAQYGLVMPESPKGRAPKQRTKAHFGVSVGQLVEHGMIPERARLVGSQRGADYRAQLTVEGYITIDSGETFESPSAAAGAVLDRPSWNGWAFWRVVQTDGTTATLDAIRKTALQNGIVGD